MPPVCDGAQGARRSIKVHGTSIDIPNFGPRRVREAPFVGLGSQEFDACGISIDVERQKRRGRRQRGT